MTPSRHSTPAARNAHKDTNRARLRDLDARIAATGDLHSLGEAVLEACQVLIGVSGLNFFPLRPGVATARDATLYHESIARERMAEYTLRAMHWSEQDFGSLRRFWALRRAFNLNDMLRSDRLEQTRTFNEYWRPCHIERQLFSPLGDPQNVVGFLCVTRSSAERAFGPKALEMLEWIRERCFRAMRRISQNDHCSARVIEVLKASLPLACAIFDPTGTLLWLSARAEIELGTSTARLGATSFIDDNAELRSWRAAALHAASGVRIMDGVAIDRLTCADGSNLILVRRDEATPLGRAVERVRAKWKLTRREAEVVAELAMGCSNKAIAAVLECSLRTVEVHVSSILHKARSSSRSEVVAQVWHAGF